MAAELAILGAGATGLGAGLASGAPVFEAAANPGGICSSYYIDMEGQRRSARREDEEDFRFEVGGGHWIFGGNPAARAQFERFAEFEEHERKSAVYLPAYDTLVPYPLQEHPESLPPEIAQAVRAELAAAPGGEGATMAEWLHLNFGETLNTLFFSPFSRLYTAGLYAEIAPQDAYKTPQARSEAARSGYNARFLYPKPGLDRLFGAIAEKCDVRYGMKAVRVDPETKRLRFANGDTVRYETLISTLPLHTMMRMTGLDAGETPDPFTSVLVINAGARRGPRFPDVHWLYVPESRGGFHRVGFYDAVSRDFLPKSLRDSGEYTAIYIEKAFPGGYELGGEDIRALIEDSSSQLQDWGFIGDMFLADPTYVETAYTWRRPGSSWRERSLELLSRQRILQAGRFARWTFQGMAASFIEGIDAGRKAHPESRE